MLFKNTIFQLDFRYELSYILVPLSILLYVYIPAMKPVLMYHMVCAAIIGTIDTLLKDKNGIVMKIASIILHLLLLLVLYDFNKYENNNLLSIALLIVANLIIIFLPYWPYELSKMDIVYLYNFIYIALFCLFYFSRKVNQLKLS
jgi:hypothetical protein